jgi:hypothetical protein
MADAPHWVLWDKELLERHGWQQLVRLLSFRLRSGFFVNPLHYLDIPTILSQHRILTLTRYHYVISLGSKADGSLSTPSL